jgi:hypothetical protein
VASAERAGWTWRPPGVHQRPKKQLVLRMVIAENSYVGNEKDPDIHQFADSLALGELAFEKVLQIGKPASES